MMSSDARHTTGQLIQPSTLLPWSVEVVTAVPTSIMRLNETTEEPKKKKKKIITTPSLDSSKINAGAVCSGWSCLASWKGLLYVWSITTTTTSSRSGGSSPLKQQKAVEAPKNCVTLFHPSLVSISEDSPPPLIAMTPASPDAVYVYACNPSDGGLVCWKVSMDDIHRAQTISSSSRTIAYAHTVLPLERQEVDDDEDVVANLGGELEEFATSLTVVNRHMVVLGTSKGSLVCCTQSTIPLALHAQRMLKASRSRRSLVGRLIFGSGEPDDGAPDDDSQIVFALPLPSYEEGCTDLLAVSLWGTIWHWKIKDTVATSHRVETEATCLTTIATLFIDSLPNMNLTHVEILQAKSNENRMHVLVRTTTQESDSKLFWVRLRLERDGSKVALHWMDCQWLNRFPAPQDIEAMGLVLSENEMAYAAFHQGSGGVTSSVIVMALPDSRDDTDADSMTIYEVDLPITEIPCLLPGTFANDVVTHGVCIFARSGLGIRVRALPPATTAAALSPRAVKRANPSAVLKLTNHLRGSFWQAYQHQGATGSNLALPPSILEASPVDLEEAVIAVATQIHTQRSSDATGWSVSTALEGNALEFHLALISWLRHGGMYRSLSTYCKWRLMAFGQEIAAFLDLVAPTMSPTSTPWEQQQISTLSLSQVASWLKQTLETTLRDGGMDHYQLWCAWFSTALATSMAYRKERAGTTYDITSPDRPPLMGSRNDDDDEEEESQTRRVPVWTSHPVLQEIFGTLLQHWKTHPKHKNVLRPQTVEIIARAALDSFADSAESLSSDRSIGKYAEIKAMTIPLLRTLHPPTPELSTLRTVSHSDDKLAFQLAVRHEYYAGICEMALDHENKPDADHFRLSPLLKSVDQCQSTDFQTGFTFGQFVLHFFTDRELFGHVILYGRDLNHERDLNHMLQSDERLRPYRWIQAVHKGDYNGAASSLMGQAEKSATVTLAETKWSFCMAKLANAVVLKESQSQRAQAEKRDLKINNTLELVGVQRELLAVSSGLSRSQSGQHLWSANRLLSRALEQAEQAMAKGSEDRTETATKNCYLGLLVCVTFEDKAVQQRQAVQVWSKAIAVDWEMWTSWIRTEDSYGEALARTILETTVFGGLLQEYAADNSLANVAYCESMENEIIQQLGLVGDGSVDSLRRLLSTVKAFLEANGDEEMTDV